MENIHVKVTKALDEKALGCKVSKIKRDQEAKLSISHILHPSIPIEYVDDIPTCMEHEVQVDIWADYNKSIHSVTQKVITLMQNNGFELVSIRGDMYEPDTNIVHKPLIFQYLEKLE